MAEKRERRMCTRTSFLTNVILRPTDTVTGIKAELLNISMSGMFIRIDQVIPVGTACTIEIQITGNHSRLLLEDIKGEVVRQDEQGVAIRFTSLMEWFVLFKVYAHYCLEGMGSAGSGDFGV